MKKLSGHEAAALGEKGWTVEGHELVLVRDFPSFRAAWTWLGRVAEVAETHDHHPSVRWSYRRVELRLTTHDAGDRLTTLDRDVAEAIATL